ncbi:hypothetical protein CDAR_169291 [Caerostris darwini]|uniref:Uncharacterized protein n=1 Tax=Caerostris darwini TaxID=1538125 RepID=A0AAV4QKT4_9ARAC|nr:hypothetical protein CDAR_169291 [Caerostris darwini]
MKNLQPKNNRTDAMVGFGGKVCTAGQIPVRKNGKTQPYSIRKLTFPSQNRDGASVPKARENGRESEMAGRRHGNQTQEGRLGWEEKSTRCRLQQKRERASIFQGSLTEAREKVVCFARGQVVYVE